MAIQPIDIQILLGQTNNAAQETHNQHFAGQIQQNTLLREQLRAQETASAKPHKIEKTLNSAKVNEVSDGSNNSNSNNENEDKNKKDNNEIHNEEVMVVSSEPIVKTIVDEENTTDTGLIVDIKI